MKSVLFLSIALTQLTFTAALLAAEADDWSVRCYHFNLKRGLVGQLEAPDDPKAPTWPRSRYILPT